MQSTLLMAILALPFLSGVALAENTTPAREFNPRFVDKCATQITKKTIHKGMTKEQVVKVWGTPKNTLVYPKPTETNDNFGSGPKRWVPITEEWEYKVASVYFNGNIVTSILDGKYSACLDAGLKNGSIWK